MSERLPEDLSILYSAFSKEAINGIFPGDSFFVDDVEFVCKYSPESTANRFFIVKPLKLVDQFVADLFTDYFGFLPKNVSGGTLA